MSNPQAWLTELFEFEYGGHPRLADWRYEVNHNDTLLGFADWLDQQEHAEEEPVAMRVTVSLLFATRKWLSYCELTDTNEWAVNEGLMNEDDEVPLTHSQAVALGFLPYE